jgi:hypothetical protein
MPTICDAPQQIIWCFSRGPFNDYLSLSVLQTSMSRAEVLRKDQLEIRYNAPGSLKVPNC